ncbi:MAG: Type II secretion system protein, partial [Thermococcales archaeon 44_46]
MEEKKKKRSGLSWIEEILSEEAAPLEDIIKEGRREEEKPKAKEELSPIVPEIKTPSKPLSAESQPETSLEEILKSTRGSPRVPLPTYYGEEVKVLDVYGNVRILRVKGEPIPIYEIRLPKLSEEEEKLVKIVRDRAIAEIQIDPESIPDPEERRRIFGRAVKSIMRELAPAISEARMDILVNLVVQNMIGYGKLDPLVRDDNLEEVMVIG